MTLTEHCSVIFMNLKPSLTLMKGSSTGVPFQRARSAEHQDMRRATIVETCRTLLETTHPLDIRIRPLASLIGIAPSGIYRYFENIQSLLLHVHLCDVEEMVSGLEIDLMNGINEPGAVAKALSTHFLQEPRFLLLFSLTPVLYEREVSVETLTDHKLALLSHMERAAIALMHTGLFRTPQDATQAFGQMLAFALGLYPLANPSDPAKSALKHPQLTFLDLDMAVELEEGLGILLKGWHYEKMLSTGG